MSTLPTTGQRLSNKEHERRQSAKKAAQNFLNANEVKEKRGKNEWINKRRMFKQRHSFPTNVTVSHANANLCSILSEKNEKDDDIN